ncbi:MAG TPA: glycosyltransferase [Pseudonocardia sp.]|uniref:glycosyltransferase n=1 Tax=Pseudonocardia sp. TaxID=60912 RepID=UPI002C858FF2|nr:glycosyltransferase [Pseudonocardia sp.]HTF48474.1 glycosyltransferase [Pseudonocardia sp.]
MTTLFVATTGGHLAQLDQLSRRIPVDPDSVWVTHANEQSTSLLADRDVEYVPYIGFHDIPGVLKAVPHAHRLLRERKITRAVSTGSAIALAYLPYLAARGVECHYIESAARVSAPSATGKVLRRVPLVRTYAQYPHWPDDGWLYGGSSFDIYLPAEQPRELGDTVRVVVTVGTAAEFPFRRLIEPLAPLLAEDGPLSKATERPVEVLWQTGCTPVDGLGIEPRPFMPAAELDAALANADIVIAHAGTGSALAVLAGGRKPLMALRLERYGEAGDDHQKDLAAELSRRGLATTIADPAELTADDLLATLSDSVVKTDNPPPFRLVDGRTGAVLR